MKKPKVISQFTMIDILILIFVISAVIFSLYTIIFDDTGDVETYIFDSETIQNLPDKYIDLYQNGEIVEADVLGYNSQGKEIEAYGTVKWVDTYKGGNIKVTILPNNSSNVIMAAYDSDDADIFIKQITLKSTGNKYKNVVDIQIQPQSISKWSDLISKMPKGTNYTISTRISVTNINNNLFQNLSNAMYDNLRTGSIRPTFKNSYLQLSLISANQNDIELASDILGKINGESDKITIRVYNADQEQINQIENHYDALSINKIT